MNSLKVKIVALATAVGSITTGCVNKSAPRALEVGQKQHITNIIQQPITDTLVKTTKKISVSDLTKSRAVKDDTLKSGVSHFVNKFFNEEDTKILLKNKSAEEYIQVAVLVAKNTQREKQGLSASTISMLSKYGEDDKNLVEKFVLSKQRNNKFYSDNSIREMANQLTISSDAYGAKELIIKMIDKGFAENEIAPILESTRNPAFKITAFKMKKVNNLLNLKNKKTGEPISANNIIKAVESMKIPEDILFR